jgi:hypothetical protein
MLGGLLQKTKKGSATFTEAGLSGTGGNSGSRITGAKSAGSSALDAFQDILERLDATAANIKFSTGIRKESFVLDPTGAGRTKGAGVLNFGKDEQAYMEAVVREIFADASFTGLSEGFAKLLKSGGDIEKQVEKVFSLKGAFDELASIKDPQGFALGNLDKEFDKLRAYAVEAGEGLAQVEELYGLKRKDILDKNLADSLELERTRRGMEAELLRLSGDEIGATAIARQLEREQLDPSLVALYDQIAARQEEVDAAQKAADAQKALADATNAAAEAAQAEANRLADSLADLQIRLARAQGNDALGTALERAREYNAALTDQERAMLKAIYAADDLMAAQNAAAEAAKAQADKQIELAASYNHQAQAMVSVIERMREATKGLREFADELFGPETISDTAAMQQRVLDTIKLAGAGNRDAIANLPGVIQAYLPQAMNGASSQADYDAFVAFARQATLDVADINDARTRLRSEREFGSGGSGLIAALRRVEERVDKLNDTFERGTDRQVAATEAVGDSSKKTARILGSVTDNGVRMLT